VDSGNLNTDRHQRQKGLKVEGHFQE